MSAIRSSASRGSRSRVRCSSGEVKKGSSGRLRKIEAQLQRVLAELIARGIKDPRVGSVTITGVSLSADMGVARVYFTPFASAQRPEEVQSGLAHAAGFLRGEAGRRLALRHAPRLDFMFDDTAEKAARLTGLIDRAVADDSSHGD